MKSGAVIGWIASVLFITQNSKDWSRCQVLFGQLPGWEGYFELVEILRVDCPFSMRPLNCGLAGEVGPITDVAHLAN